MFDDQNNSQGQPPTNLPTEPADMFEGVDKIADAPIEPPNALEAGVLKKKEGLTPPAQPSAVRPANTNQPTAGMDPNVMPQMGGNSMYAVKEPILGKVIMALLLAVILGGLGFGGWWVYTNYMNPPEAPIVDNIITNETTNIVIPENIEQPIESPVETVVTNTVFSSDATIKMNNDKILFGEPVDTDKDGLDDVREKELGTDMNNADTDADGLLDGDEVIVIKTNPLNPDTDGDGYKDGEEVRNGYNPLGSGKLFNPTVTSTVSGSTNTSTAVSTSTKSTTTTVKTTTTTKTTTTKK